MKRPEYRKYSFRGRCHILPLSLGEYGDSHGEMSDSWEGNNVGM